MRFAVPLLCLISPLTALAMPQEGAEAAPAGVVSAPTPATPAAPAPSAPIAPQVATPAPAPRAQTPAAVPSSPTGVAVVALGNSSEEAWPLAQAVYGRPKLRPPHLSEEQVRVLAGEPLSNEAPPALQELASDRANLGGDPSTTSLISLGSSLHVAALYVVVSVPSKVAGAKARSRARLFSVSSRSFVSDWKAPSGDTTWTDAAKSAEVSLADKPEGKPFYASPWFWGALGAAAALGTTAIVLASTKSTDTLTLRGEVLR